MNEIKGTVASVENIKGSLNVANGFDGESAYEIALKNGFEGTEAEWLESLHGKDGYTPIKNVDYFDGKSGVYVGSGDMPDDCNVQIDPDGDAISFDQISSVANAIKGTASGTEVCIKDISPIPHNIGVKLLNADAKLYKGGKNLLPYPYYTAEGGIRTHRGISFVVNADRSITINGTNDGTGDSVFYCMLDKPIVLPKGSYIASGVNNYTFVGYTGSAYILFSSGRTLTEPIEFKSLYFNVPSGASVNNLVVKPMLETGITATEYEPYVEPTECVVNTDKTANVPSLYPTTRLYTDTDGVTIEAEYNRDINKAFAELQQAVAQLSTLAVATIPMNEGEEL